jgi:hypothetical protein
LLGRDNSARTQFIRAAHRNQIIFVKVTENEMAGAFDGFTERRRRAERPWQRQK